jgi:hypothetical protein
MAPRNARGAISRAVSVTMIDVAKRLGAISADAESPHEQLVFVDRPDRARCERRAT